MGADQDPRDSIYRSSLARAISTTSLTRLRYHNNHDHRDLLKKAVTLTSPIANKYHPVSIFISGLNDNVTEAYLQNYLQKDVSVRDVVIPRVNGNKVGIATVRLPKLADAEAFVNTFNSVSLAGSKLSVILDRDGKRYESALRKLKEEANAMVHSSPKPSRGDSSSQQSPATTSKHFDRPHNNPSNWLRKPSHPSRAQEPIHSARPHFNSNYNTIRAHERPVTAAPLYRPHTSQTCEMHPHRRRYREGLVAQSQRPPRHTPQPHTAIHQPLPAVPYIPSTKAIRDRPALYRPQRIPPAQPTVPASITSPKRPQLRHIAPDLNASRGRHISNRFTYVSKRPVGSSAWVPRGDPPQRNVRFVLQIQTTPGTSLSEVALAYARFKPTHTFPSRGSGPPACIVVFSSKHFRDCAFSDTPTWVTSNRFRVLKDEFPPLGASKSVRQNFEEKSNYTAWKDAQFCPQKETVGSDMEKSTPSPNGVPIPYNPTKSCSPQSKKRKCYPSEVKMSGSIKRSKADVESATKYLGKGDGKLVTKQVGKGSDQSVTNKVAVDADGDTGNYTQEQLLNVVYEKILHSVTQHILFIRKKRYETSVNKSVLEWVQQSLLQEKKDEQKRRDGTKTNPAGDKEGKRTVRTLPSAHAHLDLYLEGGNKDKKRTAYPADEKYINPSHVYKTEAPRLSNDGVGKGDRSSAVTSPGSDTRTESPRVDDMAGIAVKRKDSCSLKQSNLDLSVVQKSVEPGRKGHMNARRAARDSEQKTEDLSKRRKCDLKRSRLDVHIQSGADCNDKGSGEKSGAPSKKRKRSFTCARVDAQVDKGVKPDRKGCESKSEAEDRALRKRNDLCRGTEGDDAIPSRVKRKRSKISDDEVYLTTEADVGAVLNPSKRTKRNANMQQCGSDVTPETSFNGLFGSDAAIASKLNGEEKSGVVVDEDDGTGSADVANTIGKYSARTAGYSRKDWQRNTPQDVSKYHRQHGHCSFSSRDNRLQNRKFRKCISSINPRHDLFNANVLKQRKKPVQYRKSNIHGMGLFSCEAVEAGEFIIEYIGEVLRRQVSDIREARYMRRGMGDSYMFRLNEHFVLDATHMGCIARFINHSCDPNLLAKIIPVDGSNRIVFYSKRHIKVDEELTYDYKFDYEDDDKKIACLCGSSNCRKYLN